jgi:hypothetical protein
MHPLRALGVAIIIQVSPQQWWPPFCCRENIEGHSHTSAKMMFRDGTLETMHVNRLEQYIQ